MGTISDKLTYLNTTKTKIKDAINLTGANITNDTFRSYEAKLKSGLVDIINNGTDTLYNNFPKVTATGSSATLEDTYEAILKIDLKGNTSQTGTPSPISPQNIQVVTGNNTIKICSNNLYDVFDRRATSTAITTDNDGWMTIDYSNTSGSTKYPNWYTYTSKFLKPSTDYWMVLEIKGNKLYTGNPKIEFVSNSSTDKGQFATLVQYYLSDDDLHDGAIIIKKITTRDNFDDCFSMTRSIATVENNASLNLTFRMSILDYEPTVDTFVYEPYQSQSYPINLGTLEVRNIEGYQDYIYKSSGKWYLKNYYGKVVLDSSENWSARDNTSFSADVLRFRYDLTGVSYANMTIPGIMSNRFVGRTQDIHDLEGITRQPSVTGINVYIYKSRLNGTGASAFKTWLNANNITCYYLPSSTIDTEITDTTLIEQLDALQNAMSYEGQTNINAEYISGNQPFIMNIVALKNE